MNPVSAISQGHRARVEERLSKLKELHARVVAEIESLEAAIACKPRTRRSRHDPRPDCGSEQGYQYHRYHGELRCDDCKAAHSDYNAGRSAS